MRLMNCALRSWEALLYSAASSRLLTVVVFLCLLSPEIHAQYHHIYGQQQLNRHQHTTSKSVQRQSHKGDQSSSGSTYSSHSVINIHPVAEVVVVGPGPSIYSRFGHIAIRIKSKTRDVIYDLGVAQHGGWRGLKNLLWGQAEFTGQVRSFPKALNKWKRHDRDVSVYPLYINEQMVATLYRELEARVGGRVPPYLYDPFRENCATQLR
jgi:hypothetical protein